MAESTPVETTEAPNSTLSVPLKLDAFVLNSEVCNGAEDDAKIAPITQPNYTFLRLTNFIIQNDIFPHVDLHNTTPSTSNSRLTDLGTDALRASRQGVYVHWMLPRVYRSGVAATESGPNNRQKEGLPQPKDPENTDDSVPQFRPVPSRWLVIRRLHPKTAQPDNSGIPEFQAWVVESDRKSDIKDIPVNTDLQVDVSPFVYPTRQVNIEQQAEVFIGAKFPAKGWKEDTTADRVPLSLLNGGNILFADFQQHNGNVFSIVDNFAYQDPDGDTTLYLEKATASYYVIGWHPDDNEDPFHIVQQTDPEALKISRSDRLANCQMTFNDPTKPDTDRDAWLQIPDSANVVCHGAIYTVEWDVSKKPKHVPADIHSRNLQHNLPLAVSTTPLDSLLAYIHAHKDGETDPDIKQVIDSIIFIQKYLITLDDSVDGQQQADDLLYNYNYDAVTGGTHYYLAGSDDPTKPAKQPDPIVASKLATLNREQFRLDTLKRTVNRTQWELFSLWWKFVCDGTNPGSSKIKVEDIMKNWTDLLQCIQDSSDIINSLLDPIKEPDLTIAKPGVLPSFYQQRDPTLLVGNIESGWPHDWLESLKVRLNTQITAWADRDQLGDIGDEVGIGNLPTTIQDTAKALLKEFLNLDPDITAPIPDETYVPLYHDLGVARDKSPAPWRDRWDSTQPWFPLFLEWEVEYSHVSYSSWSLEERTGIAPGNLPTATKLRYGTRVDDIPLFDPSRPDKTDKRTLSGRVLILPQPNFSLESKISQLFDNMPATERDKVLPEDKRKQLLDNFHKLAFLSSPLAGFHDHLLTTVQGTHIKPNVRHAGEKLVAIDSAFNIPASFGKDQFNVIGTETDLTPYGTLVQFYDFPHSAFKPVTHGQFKFTKLNIIDKFGQAIHAIDPRWSPNPPQPVYPCVSEFYAPQVIEYEGEKIPNTVEKQDGGPNEFVQMGPHVNQLTRLNATFVKRGDDGKSWVPQNEWENPIWGWIVINYAEYGIQIFLADGTFYREVRLGGQTGASTSDEWLPFDRPTKPPANLAQLDHLIARLGNTDYLHAFVDMINDSLQHAAPAPDAYAQFLNSVVGKPLALVNMGWSLEMAADAYVNQSTLNDVKPDIWLLPDPEGGQRDLYTFQYKLGDQQRSYDGLVGYFRTLETQTNDGNDLQLDLCYTFFGFKDGGGDDVTSPVAGSPLVKISKDNYPVLEPYFIDPKLSSSSIETKRNAKLAPNTFGALIDPFTAVHAYSGILPTQPLKLPTWTWQEALSRMTAFFHMGPLVLTKDVPSYNSDYKLKAEYDLKTAQTVPGSAIGIPAMAAAEWDWLQPYSVDEAGGGEEQTVFTPLGLGGTDTRPRFEEAPYTAIEGFLQLKRAIVRDA